MSQVKGIIGEKLGMTQIFQDTRAIPVTVISAGPCVVAQVKTVESDGYDAVQLAFGTTRTKDVTKPMKGHYEKLSVEPARHLVELRTDDAAQYSPGQVVDAGIFQPGDVIDAVGVSKGKGFSGPMKRHGFAGLGAGHGTQRKHRSPGSIGACSTPSRVFKGMRMAGQFGGGRVTVLNLEVVQSDPERNLLLIKGALPGPNGQLIMVRSAVKNGKGA